MARSLIRAFRLSPSTIPIPYLTCDHLCPLYHSTLPCQQIPFVLLPHPNHSSPSTSFFHPPLPPPDHSLFPQSYRSLLPDHSVLPPSFMPPHSSQSSGGGTEKGGVRKEGKSRVVGGKDLQFVLFEAHPQSACLVVHLSPRRHSSACVCFCTYVQLRGMT